VPVAAAADADADHRGGDHLGGAGRRPGQRGHQDHRRRARLADQAVHRPDPEDPAPDRPDDRPATERRPQGERNGAGQLGPDRHHQRADGAVGQQERRQHPDRLLGVVGSVGERQPARGQPLGPLHQRADTGRRPPQSAPEPTLHRPGGAEAEQRRDGQRRQGADHAGRVPPAEAAPVDRPGPGVDHRRPHQPPDQGVAGAGRQPPPPGGQVPGHGSGQGGADHGDGLGGRHLDDGRDGVGHRRPQQQRAQQVADRGQGDRRAGPGTSRRDQGGDGVGRVVEAVGERERQGRHNGQHERRVHRYASPSATRSSHSASRAATRPTCSCGSAWPARSSTAKVARG
jgi:hypothetical protein